MHDQKSALFVGQGKLLVVVAVITGKSNLFSRVHGRHLFPVCCMVVCLSTDLSLLVPACSVSRGGSSRALQARTHRVAVGAGMVGLAHHVRATGWPRARMHAD